MNPVDLNFLIREGANDVEGEYERFMGQLRHILAHHPKRQSYITQYGVWLEEHPLLPVQLALQPARWIHINLILQDEFGVEETRTTIAVRDDNVYLKGFKNRHDKWYELGKEGRNTPFIAGSTFLGCDVGYPGLVGGSDNLVSLSLTKYDVIRAIRGLSNYQQTGPADGETRHHLVRLCVIICECARMIPHHGAVRQRWNGANLTGITPEQAENIKDWSKMSRELLRDPNPEGNMYLDIVHLLLNTRERIFRKHDQQGQVAGGGGSSQQGQGSSKTQMPSTRQTTSSSGGGGRGAQEQKVQTGGNSVRTRPLLEVLSVEAKIPGIDTIAVLDGKRGQIIYKHDRGESQYQGYYRHANHLALTGPYKAISAEGSFVIQAYGNVSGTDASDKSSKSVMGEMFWDCYDDGVEYDKVLTGNIISTGIIQDTLAKVSYAVLSDAVEATVEVNLLLPAGITLVYGEISAGCESLRYRPLLLFSGGQDEKVELVPSGGADSMVPLELGRCVVVVPVLSRYSRLRINIQLHVSHPKGNGDVLLGGDIRFYLDSHTGETRIDQNGGIFVPVGWAGVSDPKDGGTSHGSRQGEVYVDERIGTSIYRQRTDNVDPIMDLAVVSNPIDGSSQGELYVDGRTGALNFRQRTDNVDPTVSLGSSKGASSLPSRQGTEQTSKQQVKVQVSISSPGFHLSPLEPDSAWRKG